MSEYGFDEDSVDIEPTSLSILLDKLKEKITERPLYTVGAVFVTLLVLIIVISAIVGSLKKGIVEPQEPTEPTEITTEAVVTEAPTEATTEYVLGIDEAQRIATKVFSNAYTVIDGGNSFANWDFAGEITYKGYGVKAYSVNIGMLKPYFTQKALDFIGTHFTDTPEPEKAQDIYGNTGTYYIFANGKSRASSFSNTLFSTVDHKKQDLTVIFADNERIVATVPTGNYGSEEKDAVEYIVFALEDTEWKIDSFEDFSQTVNTLDLEVVTEENKTTETTAKPVG